MKIRKSLATVSLTAVLAVTAACSSSSDAVDTAVSTTTATSSTTTTAPVTSGQRPAGGRGGGAAATSASTQADLDALVQDAYGDGALDLHRGHQPVQDVLDEILVISHEELHVYMEEQELNLAAVATELGIDPQTLIDALVASRMPAVESLLSDGTITADQAAAYEAALGEAFTFRVTWDGSEEMPVFTGV